MTRTAKSWMVDLSATKTPSPSLAPKHSLGLPYASLNDLGLTSERRRAQMIERLRELGVNDEVVLSAMLAVPRHRFVDEGLASRAYENIALPIGQAQTISQPYIVAYMSQLLRAQRDDLRILEVGTGCGYQAAVLSLIAREVHSIERIRTLYDKARHNLRPLLLKNLHLIYGDGMKGLPSVAPFDGIILAAAGRQIPRALLEQLQIGGRLIAPVGDAQQTLHLIIRVAQEVWERHELDTVCFVRLKSGLG